MSESTVVHVFAFLCAATVPSMHVEIVSRRWATRNHDRSKYHCDGQSVKAQYGGQIHPNVHRFLLDVTIPQIIDVGVL